MSIKSRLTNVDKHLRMDDYDLTNISDLWFLQICLSLLLLL